MKLFAPAAAGLVLLTLPLAAQAPRPKPAIGQERAVTRHLTDDDEKKMTALDLVRSGERLFTANWTHQDGWGRPLTKGEGRPLADAGRPLSGSRTTNRVSGPDANSCMACHNLPHGAGGGGDFVSVTFDGADRFDFVTFDPGDPSAQPSSLQEIGARASPGLAGAGYLEMLARQMTEELQTIRDRVKAGGTMRLEAKGVPFGSLSRRADGSWDASGVEGLPEESTRAVSGRAPSLQIRPWYQTGRAVSLREFTNDALNRNLGLQSVERFGERADPDGDGIVDEVTRGDVTALVLFQATLPVPGRVIPTDPIVERAVIDGERRFVEIGCARCHVPSLALGNQAWLYRADGRGPRVDLTSEALPPPRLPAPSDAGGAIAVPAYTDFKLHQVSANPRSPRFLTRRLWGAANEPPYWHDGSLTTLRDAVLAHDGEALESKNAFASLPASGRDAVIEFLRTLQALPPGTRSLIVDERFRARSLPY